MILYLLLASLSFGLSVHLFDRPSIPAWQGKYAYRALAFLCWLGWVATAFKMLQFHTELTTIIPYCR